MSFLAVRRLVWPPASVLAGFIVMLGSGASPAADSPPASPTTGDPARALPTDHRDEEFRNLVANVKLVGNLTITGDEPGTLRREEYVISGATKLGTGDLWALTARIKYGDVDLTVPVPVQVKWAGSTPVITVESVKIPGLGTFSARVLLDQGRYAGTWSHDEKGGHLFGVVEKFEASPP
jgi:hypothetical protein